MLNPFFILEQHNKGNIEAVRQGWQMQISGTIGGATLCKDIPIQESAFRTSRKL